MRIKVVPRERKEYFVATIFKNERKRMGGLSKGDVLVFKLNNIILIRKVKEDYAITLPKKLNLIDGTKVELEIVKHITLKQGLERPKDWHIGDIIGGILDLKYFIPRKTIHGFDIFVIDDSNNMIVWYPVGGGVQYIRIKRFVEPEMLFEIIGFLIGDGSIKNVRSIRFTNSEPSVLSHCISFFQTLGLGSRFWKAQIIWSGQGEPSEEIKDECRNFWYKHLNLPKENIKSVLWSKGKSNSKYNGSARIFIDNAILEEIFVESLVRWIKKKVKDEELNSEILKSLLRGILAAEGSITSFNGVVRSVTISFNPHSDEEILFRTILHKLKITTLPTHKNKNEFGIGGWNNFLKLFHMRAFELHARKNRLFIDSFMKHKCAKMVS